eukprot:CAMPEP_0181294034 /NCGR_PEP_ID=MMETSP1101-20121128/3381_1 /TAXON_ID=46948 /ORGANISM="Rhodomonas abbreviata, Strain Caron Lab Isolate" /LENGTH=558 /DNA_ID=CAMNT_0023398657 /DNA_START=116 /DNA_END=1792 /DNA_ORIENTATION=-
MDQNRSQGVMDSLSSGSTSESRFQPLRQSPHSGEPQRVTFSEMPARDQAMMRSSQPKAPMLQNTAHGQSREPEPMIWSDVPYWDKKPMQKVENQRMDTGRDQVWIATKEVPVPVDHYVPVEKVVDRFVEVPVEKIVYRDKPIEVEKVVTKEVPVPVEVPVHSVLEKVVFKEVPVERVVVQEVPVFVDKIVFKEVPVPVDKIVYQDRMVEIERVIEKEVMVPTLVERVVEVEKLVPVTKEVPVEKIVEVVKQIEVPVEKIVYVDKIVEKEVIKYVDKIIEKEVPVYIDKIVEKEKIVEVTKEVPVERIVVKEIPVDRIIEKIVEVKVDRLVIKEVPVEVEKIVERQVEVEKIVYKEPEEEPQMRNKKSSDQKVQRSAPPPPQPVRSAPPPPPPVPATPPPPPRPVLKRSVGLGLQLERGSDSQTTYIHEIIPGFAAFRSGRFKVGDIVVSVDSQAVDGWDLEQIKRLTVGEEGSLCTVELQRGSHFFFVTLERLVPDVVDMNNFEAFAKTTYNPATGLHNSSRGSNYPGLHDSFASTAFSPAEGLGPTREAIDALHNHH